MLARRQLAPRYVLIHRRWDNYDHSQRRRSKRAELGQPDERLMSFDRLTPAENGVLYSTVRKRRRQLPGDLSAAQPRPLV
jgi:hypothetical protein